MKYRTKRSQIFRRGLGVPQNIKDHVYYCRLTFPEMLEYELTDKVPISCLNDDDRALVERFGIEKCMQIDWELVGHYYLSLLPRKVLMTIDPQTEDINHTLYERLKYKIPLYEYSPKMKEFFSDMVFKIEQNDEMRDFKENFNRGIVDLKEIFNNWEVCKDKDLSYCLLHDSKNNVTDSIVKEFMNRYDSFVPIIEEIENVLPYIFPPLNASYLIINVLFLSNSLI